MTDYEWLTSMGLCHRCRKKKAAPRKKFCFDCLDKIQKENARRYDSEKAKAYQKRRREIYREKQAAGVCVRCDKPATHGMYCYNHSIAARRRSISRAESNKKKRHERGLITEERKKEGLCLWCGKKAVQGLQCCEEHRAIFSQAGKRAKKKMRW